MSRRERVIHRRIEGLHCSFCVSNIEDALSRIDGVREYNVSIAHEEIYIKYDPERVDGSEIEALLEGLGYRLRDVDEPPEYEKVYRVLRRRLLISTMLSLVTGLFMLGMWLGTLGREAAVAMGLIAGVNFLFLGREYIVISLNSLRRGILNQHVLMFLTGLSGILGGIIGLLTGFYPPGDFFGVASFVTTYHLLGGYSASYVRKKSDEAVRRLLRYRPRVVRVRRGGTVRYVGVEDVEPGEVVIVDRGESIPLDGILLSSYASIDESIVTGEPLPVDKYRGDEVVSGSINLSDPVEISVTRRYRDSFLHRLVMHIREARALKPPILSLLDRVLKRYISFVLITAVVALILWGIAPLILGQTLEWVRPLYVFMTVLVMGYPCALGMAIPLAIIRGSGVAAERGILIRNGEAIEILSGRPYLLVDKTGTITLGRPRVVGLGALNGFGVDELLRVAGCLESYSRHPVAEAIYSYILERLGEIDCGEVSGIEVVPGMGIKGRVDGHWVAIGSREFMDSIGVSVDVAGEEGVRTVYIAIDGVLAGYFYLSDVLREDVANAVEELRQYVSGVALITGDSEESTSRLVKGLNLDWYRSGLKPGEKAGIVRSLQARGYRVVMVGDGFNDAPSVTLADVGVAFGVGSDITAVNSDVLIVSDRFDRLVDLFRLSRRMYGRTRTNLFVAFIYNGLGIPLAALGLIQPYWAMIFMVLSVTSLLINSLRSL